jgi:transcriptional regulator with XRE-family HTH domain
MEEIDVYEEIKIKAIQKGVTLGAICDSIGVSRATLTNWRKRTPISVQTYIKIERYFEELDEQLDKDENEEIS